MTKKCFLKRLLRHTKSLLTWSSLLRKERERDFCGMWWFDEKEREREREDGLESVFTSVPRWERRRYLSKRRSKNCNFLTENFILKCRLKMIRKVEIFWRPTSKYSIATSISFSCLLRHQQRAQTASSGRQRPCKGCDGLAALPRGRTVATRPNPFQFWCCLGSGLVSFSSSW